MAEIADIAFRADDRALVRAKMSMQALGPASRVAGAAVDNLGNALDDTARAAGNTESAATRAAKGMLSLSSAATAAARAENARATAAVKAAQAMDNVDMSAVKAARAMQRKTAATLAARAADEQAAQAALKLSQANDRLADARPRNPNNPQNPVANDNGVKIHNVANLAAQGFDVVTTAAGGMQAGLIGMQQGLQIAQVAMTSTEGFAKTLAASFAAMLSPVVILSVVLTTLVAVLIQAVNWSKTAAVVVDALASVLQTVAPYAAAVAVALALIYGPAIIGGLLSVTAYITGIGIAAGIAGAQMAAAWVLAMGPIGWIVTGIALAATAIYAFRDDITKAIGVDVVDVTRKAANYIIGSFVAAYEDIKLIWNNFPDVIGAAVIGAVNAVIRGVNDMISYSEMGVQKLAGILNNIPGVDINIVGSAGRIDELENEAAKRLSKSMVGRNEAVKAALNYDYVGEGIKLVGDGADYATGKLKKLSEYLNSDKEKKKKKGGKTSAEKYSDIVDGAERQIATLEAEQAAIGKSTFETARLKYETQLLNEAQQKGITLTAMQKNELGALASQMAATEEKTKQMKDALDFAKDATKGFFSDLRSGIEEGKSIWKSFGDAAMNVLNKVIDKMLDQLIDAIFEVNSASSKGGAGGGLGGLISGALSWLFSAKGNAFNSNGVAAFAKGGTFTNSVVSQPTAFTYANGGAFGVMGEAGPEAIMPLSRGADGSLGVRMTDANTSSRSGGGNTPTVVSYNDNSVFNIGEGADKQTVADLKRENERRRKTFKADVQAAVDDNRRRNKD